MLYTPQNMTLMLYACQDKLVLRVQTANNEVAHLQEFDYGKSTLAKPCHVARPWLWSMCCAASSCTPSCTANDAVGAVVTNGQGQLDQCVRQIDAIIEAEKCKRWRLVN